MNAYELAYKLNNALGVDYEMLEQSSIMLRQQADRIAELEKGGCGNCHACLVGVMENGYPVTMQRMIVCSDCGNKRCPKASNHRHKCTGSNEVGQRGSIYTTPQTKPLSDEEILQQAEYMFGTHFFECIDDPYWIGFARAIEERHGIK